MNVMYSLSTYLKLLTETMFDLQASSSPKQRAAPAKLAVKAKRCVPPPLAPGEKPAPRTYWHNKIYNDRRDRKTAAAVPEPVPVADVFAEKPKGGVKAEGVAVRRSKRIAADTDEPHHVRKLLDR